MNKYIIFYEAYDKKVNFYLRVAQLAILILVHIKMMMIFSNHLMT